MADKKIHQGRNVKRIREMLGIKQEALAYDLDMSQSTISAMEQREELDAELLERVAKVLGVPAEAIKNFNEENVINNIQNNYDGAVINGGPVVYNFNPIDKIVELYERMLTIEREKIALLEKMAGK